MKQQPAGNSWTRSLFSVLSVIVFLALVAGYLIFQRVSMVSAIKNDFKELNTVEVGKFEKLPIVDKYQLDKLDNKVSNAYHEKDDEKFLEMLQSLGGELNQLASKIAHRNYHTDWSEGVENLNAEQPKMISLDLSANNIEYRQVRTASWQIAALARASFLRGENEEGARLLMANFSLLRQLVSYRKANGGLTLIDAMIALSVVKPVVKTFKEVKGVYEKADRLFPLVKDRLEEMDELFSLVAPAMALEKTIVPAFFARYNNKTRKKSGTWAITVDESWLKKKIDHFHPSTDIFQKPYAVAEPELEIYKKRLGKLTFKSDFTYYIRGFFSPFEMVAWTLLAVSTPNYLRAYNRECRVRSDLRAIYLAFAIHYYRHKKGEFPGTLDELKPYIKAHMIKDAFTGKPYSYRRRFDDVKLHSEREGEIEKFLY